MRMERANPEAAAALTAIALAAKRHWGYAEHWIERWGDMLTITPEFVTQNFVVTAADPEPCGFGALRCDESDGVAVIDHLWVLPAAMHRGIGRRLFAALEFEAKRRKLRTLRLEADPNAEGFYLRMGMRTLRKTPASLDGTARYLPVMEKCLSGADAQ